MPFIQPGSSSGGSASTGVIRVLNAKTDYGAQGTNTGDDYTALQNWLNAAVAAPYGSIAYIPPGIYPISQQLSITAPIQMIGAGMGNLNKTGSLGTIIRPTAGFASSYALSVDTGDSTRAVKGCILQDFQIDGSNLVSINNVSLPNDAFVLDPVGDVTGINFIAQHSFITRVLVQNFQTGGIRMFEPNGAPAAGNLHNLYLFQCKVIACGSYGVQYGNGTSDSQHTGGLVYQIGKVFTFNVSASTDTFTTPNANHGYSNGDTVILWTLGGATGVSTFTQYYVVTVTASTFQLAATAGGPPIDVTANGTGGRVMAVNQASTAGNCIINDGSGNTFGGGLNLNACSGPCFNSTINGRQAKLDLVRMRNSGGGAYFNKLGSAVNGCTFRDVSQWADGTADAVNVTPNSDAAGGGGFESSGCDFTCTSDSNGNGDKTRPRYLYNIVNTHARGVRIGSYSYGWDPPSTTAWATAERFAAAGVDVQFATSAVETLTVVANAVTPSAAFQLGLVGALSAGLTVNPPPTTPPDGTEYTYVFNAGATPRALTWSGFASGSVVPPATTTGSKHDEVKVKYDAALAKWVVVLVVTAVS